MESKNILCIQFVTGFWDKPMYVYFLLISPVKMSVEFHWNFSGKTVEFHWNFKSQCNSSGKWNLLVVFHWNMFQWKKISGISMEKSVEFHWKKKSMKYIPLNVSNSVEKRLSKILRFFLIVGDYYFWTLIFFFKKYKKKYCFFFLLLSPLTVCYFFFLIYLKKKNKKIFF